MKFNGQLVSLVLLSLCGAMECLPAGVVTAPPEVSAVCPSPPGEYPLLLPNPEDCGSFYTCTWYSTAVLQHCPAGLHFSVELQVCDYPYNANCHLKTTPVPVVNVTTSGPVVNVTTPVPVSNVTTPAPIVNVTTPAPVVNETTSAPGVNVTTPAPVSTTIVIAVTTPASVANATTDAPVSTGTTPVPVSNTTTPAPDSSKTTDAPVPSSRIPATFPA